MIEPTETERAALEDLREALVRGRSLAAEGRSGGARRRELRERLDAASGRFPDHPDAAAWLAAREEALARMRRDLGREIEELRGRQEQLRSGLGRLFPPPEVQRLQGQRIRLLMDLLEILGRMAELRDIRRELGSGPTETHPGAESGT